MDGMSTRLMLAVSEERCISRSFLSPSWWCNDRRVIPEALLLEETRMLESKSPLFDHLCFFLVNRIRLFICAVKLKKYDCYQNINDAFLYFI